MPLPTVSPGDTIAATAWNAVIAALNNIKGVPVRQTVLAGPVSSLGVPAALSGAPVLVTDGSMDTLSGSGPAGWTYATTGITNGNSVAADATWKTQGAASYQASKGYSSGYPTSNTTEITKTLDLTGMTRLWYDIKSGQMDNGGEFRVYVNGVLKATHTAAATTSVDQYVTFSGLGSVVVKFEWYVPSGSNTRYCVVNLDNVRVSDGAPIVAGVGLRGDLAPVVLSFANGFGTAGAQDEVGVVDTKIDPAWSGLSASSTTYLLVDRDAASEALSYVQTHVPVAYALTAPTPISTASLSAMTADTSPGPLKAYASHVDTGGDAYKAFNGSNTDAWFTADITAARSLYLDAGYGNAFVVGATWTVGGPATAGGSANTGYGPRDFTLAGSADGVTWTTLDTVTAQTGWTLGESRVFSTDAQGTYRYLRFQVTAAASGLTSARACTHGLSGFTLTVTTPNHHWFDLATMTMKVWDGAAWLTKQRVAVGEAVTDASANVTSVTTYAYQGRYDSEAFTVGDNSTNAKAHNIGVEPLSLTVFAINSAGAMMGPWHAWTNGSHVGASVGAITRTSLTLTVHGLNAYGAGLDTIDATITKARVVASRGW